MGDKTTLGHGSQGIISHAGASGKSRGAEKTQNRSLGTGRKIVNYGLQGMIYLAAALSFVLVVALVAYILVKGIGGISWDFLTSEPSVLNNTIGILPNIINTFYIILMSLVIVLPVGIGAAIYLTEYASNKKVVAFIEFATETLTGIPSIIYGLVGLLFFCEMLGLQGSMRSGALTLVIMILPTIIRTTQESLKTVPFSYREAAVGLGATKWYTIRTVVLPSSVGGILTGCILAIGRIVGESAALIFTAGMGSVLITNFFEAMKTSGASLSVALYVYVYERGEFEVGYAIAAILVFIVLAINLIIKLIHSRLKKNL